MTAATPDGHHSESINKGNRCDSHHERSNATKQILSGLNRMSIFGFYFNDELSIRYLIWQRLRYATL
jgi:hypothetical protein